MPVQRCYVENTRVNARSRLDRSAEGVQREVGVSLPLGVVATATKISTDSDPIYFIILIFKDNNRSFFQNWFVYL